MLCCATITRKRAVGSNSAGSNSEVIATAGMTHGIFIISGIPGAGKTSVSRLLAARFERGVHIESDLLQEWIVSGGLWPNEEPAEEAQRQLRLRTRNACMLADSFFAAGFTPVIDDVVIGKRLDDFLLDIRNGPVMFVLLTPSVDVVERRDASRGYKRVFSVWGYLDEVMRRETRRTGLWIDSSDLSAEATTDLILQRRDEARVD
jgi:predicted ATPase